jgi:hypothetical protein
MSAVWIFRTVLFTRCCWSILEWFFGWGSHRRVEEAASLHPYVQLFADATAIAVLLALLGGLWFFRRWARDMFVLLLGLALLYCAIQPEHSMSPSLAPSFDIAVTGFMVMLNGVIVAMSFLPPVDNRFADET